MLDMQSYGKQNYEISTEKQGTYNDMGEICVYLFFLLVLGTRIVIIQVINKTMAITTLKTKIAAFTSFRAKNIRAHYVSTPNMSNIYRRATHMAGPGLDSDYKSILSKPLLQKEKNISGSHHRFSQ